MITMKNAKAQARVPATMAEKMAWLKELLADRTISQGTKNVAVAILMHHNERTGQCNPSQERLAGAVGMHRPAVSKAIGALLRAGWISQIRTRGTSEYQLNVEREKVVFPAEMSENRYSGRTQTDTADVCEPIQQMSAKRYTEPSREPTKETHNLNPVPAEISSAPVSPMPVNDNQPVGKGEVFSGWMVPADTLRQWETAFPHINLRSELSGRAGWYVERFRGESLFRAMSKKLQQIDEEARQARLDRKDARQADVAAGVTRDNYGRAVAGPGWIADPKARPPGADRFWMPYSPGQELVFRGNGYSITQAHLDALAKRHPEIDLRAAITAYEGAHGSVERTYDEHVTGLKNFLAALPNARAA